MTWCRIEPDLIDLKSMSKQIQLPNSLTVGYNFCGVCYQVLVCAYGFQNPGMYILEKWRAKANRGRALLLQAFEGWPLAEAEALI